jgi:hypothetical protein
MQKNYQNIGFEEKCQFLSKVGVNLQSINQKSILVITLAPGPESEKLD